MLRNYHKSTLMAVQALRYVLHNSFHCFGLIAFFASSILLASCALLITLGLYASQGAFIFFSTSSLCVWIVVWCCAMKPSMLPRNFSYFAQINSQCLLIISLQHITIGLIYYSYYMFTNTFFLFLKSLFLFSSIPLILRILETKCSIRALVFSTIDKYSLKEWSSCRYIAVTLIFSIVTTDVEYTMLLLFKYNPALAYFFAYCSYFFIAYLISSIHTVLYIQDSN